MRIFTDIASHDTTGVAPGGRIIRTDSTPDVGESTVVNGQFVFPIPEGASLEINENSFWFPQANADSIPSRAAAEFLIRYPMYDHVLFNWYLENVDADSFDLSGAAPQPTTGNTTPVLPTSLVAPSVPRCLIGGPTGAPTVGMAPNSLAILPRSDRRAAPVYGSLVTTTVDLWDFNPCYVEVTGAVANPEVVTLAGLNLTAVAGAPGVDEFLIGGTAAATATNIANAINLGTNSFSGFVAATVDPTVPERVQLRPVPATNTAVTVTTTSSGITVVESHPGTDEVMLWWKTVRHTVTEDTVSANHPLGANFGANDPALKSATEMDPDDPDLLVYVSVDDGISWYRTPYLEPIDLVNAGTELRVAFINTGTDRIYLQGFCVLFPDLLPPL